MSQDQALDESSQVEVDLDAQMHHNQPDKEFKKASHIESTPEESATDVQLVPEDFPQTHLLDEQNSQVTNSKTFGDVQSVENSIKKGFDAGKSVSKNASGSSSGQVGKSKKQLDDDYLF